MLEQKVQARLIKELRGLGAYVVKVESASKKGVPDLLVCYKGRFYGIEVKQPGKERNTSPLQEYNLELIRKAGGTAFVASDIQTILKGLNHDEN